ncbi:unnamed protein product [Cylindrotheca closterium]|uniref:Telomeric single stranded DNA binding POT1/Cdc13 domain-containing protein n=1 Tax=Cylindrotheca closterium TaxID=2856 RepID=A0AAD2CMD3_9STRA|nr:unnamed protein product [Cylindrotheca closterium]
MSAELQKFFKEFLIEESDDENRDANVDTNDTAAANDTEKGRMEYTPPWTLKEWRNAQLVSMHTYFNSRIIQDTDIPEDSDEELEDYKSDEEELLCSNDSDDDSQGESQEETERFHTQEAFQGLEEKPRQRQRRIPHLSQTLHCLQNFEYLDMFTAQLDLPCCQITRVGRLRNTLRYFSTHTSKERCKVLRGRLPRIPFPHRQEDGPLLSMYKDVVHLELTNLNGKRIYIFLYKHYAKLFDEWYQEQLKKKSRSAKFWIQLKQIPGVCIFPFPINPDNLADTQQLVKYCICIGDGSNFQIPSEFCSFMESSQDLSAMTEGDTPIAIMDRNGDKTGGKLQRLRMDNPDMELRFIYATDGQGNYANSETLEFVLSQTSLKEPAARQQKGGLVEAWKKYNQHRIHVGSDSPRPSAKSMDTSSPGPKSHKQRQRLHFAEGQHHQGTVHSKHVEMPLAPTDPNLQTITYEGTAQKKDKSKDAPDCITLCELRNAMDAQPEYTKFLFSVCAAVVGFTCGRRTKRGDWMMSATLVDQTSNEKPTTLIVFAKDREDFPKISRAGDILYMHNIYLDEWNGSVQITGMKEKSSYVVVRNEEGDDWKVIPTAKDEFCFDENDEKKSQTLWHWTQHFLQQHSIIQPEHSFTLQQMVGLPEGSSKDKDMVVMVSGLFAFPPEQQDGRTPYGILRIWDGTGQSTSDPLPMQLISARHAQRHGDPPPEALKKISDVIDALVAANGILENGWQPPKALCGKVANAVVWEETYWDMIQKNLSVGSFVRMRNVEVRPWNYNGIMSVMVTNRSWLTPIPDESLEIGSLLREHDTRVQRNEYNPDSGILPTPVVENNHRNDSVGKQIEAFASNPEVMSFVGLVHLGDTYPKYDWDLKPFCKYSSDGSTFVYQFAITLCDNSGMIDVIVNNLSGEAIIGMPASLAVGTTRRKRMQIIDPKMKWMAKVMKVSLEGIEYFVLVDISHM